MSLRGHKEAKGVQEGQHAKNGIASVIGIMGLVMAAVSSTLMGTRIYKDSGDKMVDGYGALLRKSMLDQAYEILPNSDINTKIKKKTEEVALLKQKLDGMEKGQAKKRSKRRETLYNRINAQIQHKSYCLDYLNKQKEKQESYSHNKSKLNELMAEKEKLSFLHPKKKNELSNEITKYQTSMERDYKEYIFLEKKIIENEELEKELTGKYKVTRTSIRRRKSIRIFQIIVAITCICLICGIISFLL